MLLRKGAMFPETFLIVSLPVCLGFVSFIIPADFMVGWWQALARLNPTEGARVLLIDSLNQWWPWFITIVNCFNHTIEYDLEMLV